MNLLRLSITNFRSITKTLDFDFPSDAGLYFLCGENKAEPRLEANGTGKSTVWDALCWLFYNKTSRGLKAGDVCNWDVKKKCRVELEYEYQDQKWILARTWGPISWTLTNPRGETIQLAADDPGNPFYGHLKLGYVPFLNSVLVAQSEPMFLDLKSTDKSALFSQVMNLDVWNDYSQRASAMASDLDKVIRDKEIAFAAAAGSLDALKQADCSAEIKVWELQRKQRADDIEEEHFNIQDKQHQDRKRRKEVVADLEAAEEGLADSQKALPDLLDTIKVHNKSRAEWMREVSTATGSLLVLKSQLAYIEDNDVCSKCLQDISPRHKAEHVKEAKSKIDDQQKLIDRHNQSITHLNPIIDKLEASAQSREEHIEKLRRKIQTLNIELSGLDRDIKNADSNLDNLERKMESVLSEANPFKQKQDDADRQITNMGASIESMESRLDDLRTRYRMLSYWVKGFKEVRLYLIAEAMQQLEIEVNSCLSQLGLNDWQILFDVDKETKGGDIRKGFDVKILSPHNEAPVPWEAWSGGESQRLRIAATMGLANLIRSSTGCQLNLEVWDEPTQHMSEQGVGDLLDSLAERSQNYSRQIWIVDHRSLGYGNFSGIRTIIKTDSGTSLK